MTDRVTSSGRTFAMCETCHSGYFVDLGCKWCRSHTARETKAPAKRSGKPRVASQEPQGEELVSVRGKWHEKMMRAKNTNFQRYDQLLVVLCARMTQKHSMLHGDARKVVNRYIATWSVTEARDVAATLRGERYADIAMKIVQSILEYEDQEDEKYAR